MSFITIHQQVNHDISAAPFPCLLKLARFSHFPGAGNRKNWKARCGKGWRTPCFRAWNTFGQTFMLHTISGTNEQVPNSPSFSIFLCQRIMLFLSVCLSLSPHEESVTTVASEAHNKHGLSLWSFQGTHNHELRSAWCSRDKKGWGFPPCSETVREFPRDDYIWPFLSASTL